MGETGSGATMAGDESAVSTGDPIRVLHVDDQPAFLDLAAQSLERADPGLSVETATDGEAALEYVADERVDCVVSDYQMPGMDGLELLEAVRADHPDLPFVLFTGRGSEEVASDAIRAGVTDYLQKRTGTEQYELLANRVRNAVGQHRAERRAAEHERVTDVLREVNQTLVRAETVEEIYGGICSVVGGADPYLFAWVGEYDDTTDELRPRARSGHEAGYLDDVTVTTDGRHGEGPGGRAMRSGALQVVQDVRTDPSFEPWREEAIERGYRSVAAVPISYEDEIYGVLGLYADAPRAFDEAERELLAELGVDVGHAVHALSVREALRTEKERSELLVRNVAEYAIFMLDPAGRVVSWNPGAEQILGYAESDIVGEPLSTFHPEAEVAAGRPGDLLDRADATGSVQDEGWRLREDGGSIWASVTLTPLRDDDGSLRGFATILRDTTRRRERERELELYETSVNAAPDAIYALDTDLRFVLANDVLAGVVGRDPSALLGEPVSILHDADIVDGETLERRSADVQRLLDGETDQLRFEAPIEVGGQRGVTENNLAAVADEDGVYAVVNVVRDVTARRAREEELREERAFLESLVDGLVDVFYAFDPEGTFLRWNDRLAEVTGYDHDEIEAMHPTDFFEGEDVDRIASAIQTVFEEDRVVTVEADFVTRDGDRVPYEFNGTTMRDEDGSLLGLVGTGRDISDRRERERRYDAVFHGTYQFMGLMEPDGTMLEANEAALAFGGIDRGDVVGRKVWETYWWRHDPDVVADLRDAVERAADGEFVRYEVTVRGADREAVIDFSIKPVTDGDGEVVLLVPEGRDITERKEREAELRRQNERLEEFASVVSHDLRNPLNVAAGGVQLAREHGDEEPLETVERALDRMERLVDDLLTLARDGRAVEDARPVDLRTAVDDAWRTVEGVAEIEIDLESFRLEADPGRLQQVLENLLSNAVEHAGDGAGRDVRVRVGAVADGTGFYVEDDGPGVDPSDRDRVFESGFTTGEAGTGFGLAIVREIVQAHGWSIRVAEGELGGARFEITGVETPRTD